MRRSHLFFCLFSFLTYAGDFSLEGNWRAECLESPQGKDGWVREFAFVNADLVFFSMIHYEDEGCLFPKFEFRWTADYRIPTGQQGSQLLPIDFTLRQILVKPHSDAQAKAFSEQSFCDHRHWKKGDVVEVTGRKCGGNQLGKTGHQAYNAFLIDGDRLFIDYKSSVADKAQRPKKVSPHVFYKVYLKIMND